MSFKCAAMPVGVAGCSLQLRCSGVTSLAPPLGSRGLLSCLGAVIGLRDNVVVFTALQTHLKDGQRTKEGSEDGVGVSRLYMTKSGHLSVRLDEFFGDPQKVNFSQCSKVGLETELVSADPRVELLRAKPPPLLECYQASHLVMHLDFTVILPYSGVGSSPLYHPGHTYRAGKIMSPFRVKATQDLGSCAPSSRGPSGSLLPPRSQSHVVGRGIDQRGHQVDHLQAC